MHRFKNDYSEFAHEKILHAMASINRQQNTGYGLDEHSFHAAELIKKEINCPHADIHFLEGGTQTNATAIDAFLRPHEAAIAAESGHIAVHETGAVEACGHKVCTVPGKNGKLTPELVAAVLKKHPDEHSVKPKLVYISNSTEIGTIYTKEELMALHQFCKQENLWLYLDGARIGCALTAEDNDLTLADIAALTDAFYIGGTKNGALLGEALIICNDALKTDFRYLIKQNGAMLAKGMVLGVQFEVLFTDNLYFELAKHANAMAQKMKHGILQAGYSLFTDTTTNQIFPIFPNALAEEIIREFDAQTWQVLAGDTQAIRLVTSWATPPEAVEEFCIWLQAKA